MKSSEIKANALIAALHDELACTVKNVDALCSY